MGLALVEAQYARGLAAYVTPAIMAASGWFYGAWMVDISSGSTETQQESRH